jgi:hypothetical protein
VCIREPRAPLAHVVINHRPSCVGVLLRFLQLYPDFASAVVLDGVIAADITRLVFYNVDVNVVRACNTAAAP